MRKLLFVLTSVTLLSSCLKKSDSDNKACALNEIVLFGGEDPDDFHKATLEAGKIKEIKSTEYIQKSTYNNIGKLAKKEGYEIGYNTLPFKTEYVYDNGGNLIEEHEYDYVNNNQNIEKSIFYQYTNGKLSKIIFDDVFSNYVDITWTNDNISSVRYYDGVTYSCKYNFTYDLSKTNSFNSDHAQYYWQDPSDDYEAIREALFFSKNLLTKVTAECSSEPTINITYTFNSKNSIEDILVDGYKAWTFKYTCN